MIRIYVTIIMGQAPQIFFFGKTKLLKFYRLISVAILNQYLLNFQKFSAKWEIKGRPKMYNYITPSGINPTPYNLVYILKF